MTFLNEPADSAEVRARYDADRASYGFVMNLSHVWAQLPQAHTGLTDLLGLVGSTFSMRERGILVTATASTIGDSYCSWAWGWKLTEAADAGVAAGVLAGTDAGLTPREAALARWARLVARSPSGTTQADVAALREVGWSDEEIFRATTFVALRMAFSTVNGALGAPPDAELGDLAPPEVREVVTWGRPIEGRPRDD
jgi:alkylhydroperoxidase family enzyme